MNIEKLIFNDVRGWRSRLEATLPASEPRTDADSGRAADRRDPAEPIDFYCLPTLDWPPNLFA